MEADRQAPPRDPHQPVSEAAILRSPMNHLEALDSHVAVLAAFGKTNPSGARGKQSVPLARPEIAGEQLFTISHEV
jgi:hypothetical protein